MSNSNDEKPAISNDLSLYADEIDAMMNASREEELEQARQKEAERQRKLRNERKENNKEEQQPEKRLSDVRIDSVGRPEAVEKLRNQAQQKTTYLKENPNEKAHEERVAELQEHNRTGGRGMLPIDLKTLPTKGDFYPIGTKIYIKAASLGDIKHWSIADETDLSAIDDALNSIVENCVTIAFPNDDGRFASWKDLKEIDRFYIILAVHDFTFPPGQGNDIQITVNETQHVDVKKDNLEFVKFGDKIMKYYDSVHRCFSFPTKARCFNGEELKIYLPSVGVTRWLKDYVQTKNQRQEGYDRDFVNIAPLLIADHRGLKQDKYYDIIDATAEWTAYEWALVSKVKRVIETAITPKMIYKDEQGVEKETPLNFRGGIKAIFQPSMDIDL